MFVDACCTNTKTQYLGTSLDPVDGTLDSGLDTLTRKLNAASADREGRPPFLIGRDRDRLSRGSKA
ncbi:hypothetical protein LB504_008800 [Fusarium proliferatum]|nr:hypothetical protein LB504_008800 [Fusarium proliferatum]